MHSNARPRRRHSQEFKHQVISACAEPGASVEAVARSFGLNDNLVHQWRRGRGATVPTSGDTVPGFVALSLPAVSSSGPAVAASVEAIHVEIKRGPLAIEVTWPGTAAPELAAWMRELLR